MHNLIDKIISLFLNPLFIKYIDRHLLLNFPNIWTTKIHYIFYYGLCCNTILCFLLLFVAQPILNIIETSSSPGSIPFFFIVLIVVILLSVLVLITWIRRQLFFCIEKQHGSLNKSSRFFELIIYWFSAASITMGTLMVPAILNPSYRYASGGRYIEADSFLNIVALWLCIVNLMTWFVFVGKRLNGVDFIYSLVYGVTTVLIIIPTLSALVLNVFTSYPDGELVSMSIGLIALAVTIFSFFKIVETKFIKLYKRLNAMSLIAFPVGLSFSVFMIVLSYNVEDSLGGSFYLLGASFTFLPFVFFRLVDSALIRLVSLPKSR